MTTCTGGTTALSTPSGLCKNECAPGEERRHLEALSYDVIRQRSYHAPPHSSFDIPGPLIMLPSLVPDEFLLVTYLGVSTGVLLHVDHAQPGRMAKSDETLNRTPTDGPRAVMLIRWHGKLALGCIDCQVLDDICIATSRGQYCLTCEAFPGAAVKIYI